jgi:enediyne biosynthesis protein E4
MQYLIRWVRAVAVAVVIVVAIAGHDRAQAQLPAALSFTDITFSAGIDDETGSHGAMFADVNADGLPDLYLTYNNIRDEENPYRRNQFYRNAGGGVFVEEADARGLGVFGGGTHGATWADLDNDGDYDLAVALTYKTVTEPFLPEPNRIYRNDGGVFVDATPTVMSGYSGYTYTRSILAFDMERDGDLDIFAVNGDQGSNEPVNDENEFYRNDGGFNFSRITTGPAVTAPAGQGATDTDYDGDGDIDLIACNRNGDINILRNDNGVFTAVSPQAAGLYSVPPPPPGVYHRAYSGISTGDLDHDGDLDLIFIEQSLVTTAARVAHVYHNVGGGVFSYRQMIDGFSGLTAGLADLDNDTDLDLVLPGYPNVLLNNGSGTFVPGPPFPGPASGFPVPDVRSVAFADIDNDGDPDFTLTAKFGRPYMVRNDFNSGQWLKVGLFATNGQVGAFGAKIKVFAAGTSTLLGYREVKSSFGYLAQDDPVIHFGLGASTLVDVQVNYLNGAVVAVQNVSSRRTLIFNGTTLLQPPSAPQGLVASVSGTNVSLAWSAPGGGGPVAQYILEAGTAPGLKDLAVLPVGNSAGFSTGAPPGVYYVRVRAGNLAGQSGASNEVIVRVGVACSAAPPAPSAFTANVSGLNVTFNWTPTASPEPTSSYLVEAGSGPGLADLAVLETVATTLPVAGPPGVYYTRVRARNACGTSPPSNQVVVQLGCQGPPSAPTGLSFTVTGSFVTLNWAAGGGPPPSSYTIEVGFTSGATNMAFDTGNAATSLGTPAAPGTYYVRVRGVNVCGASAASNQVTIVVN